MIAVTDLEKQHLKFWARVFIAKSTAGGLAPENAAEKADLALKLLKTREEDLGFEW